VILVVRKAIFYLEYYLLKCDGAKVSGPITTFQVEGTSLQVTWNSYPESREGIFLRNIVLATKEQGVRTQKTVSSPKINVGIFHKQQVTSRQEGPMNAAQVAAWDCGQPVPVATTHITSHLYTYWGCKHSPKLGTLTVYCQYCWSWCLFWKCVHRQTICLYIINMEEHWK